MRVFNFTVFKEPKGMISYDAVWVVIDHTDGYLYTGNSIIRLLKTIIFEWKNDRHLLG